MPKPLPETRPYAPSLEHAAAVAASGFDVRDPDKRVPTQSREAEAILQAKAGPQQTQDARMAALIQTRDKADRTMDRTLALIAAFLLLMSADGCFAQAMAATPSPPSLAASRLDAPLISLLLAQLAIACLPAAAPHFFAKAHPMTAKASQTPAPLAFPKPTRAERRLRWDLDGASRQGQVRSENQDALRLFPLAPDRACLIVCDGAGGVAGGKLAAETAAQAIATALDKVCSGRIRKPAAVLLEAAVDQAREAVAALPEAGITTAIVAFLNGDVLTYATLGDGALTLVWPDGMVQQLQAPHHILGQPSNILAAFIGHDCRIPPRIGAVRIEPGAIVLGMTDGASDLLNPQHIAAVRTKIAAEIANPEVKSADALLTQMEAARDPKTQAYLHSDNMTLAMACLQPMEAEHDPR